MARIALFAALLATLVLVGSSPGAARPSTQKALAGSPTFVISGRGWGHGVGMAQWGAYGFAQQGASYEDILAHYYRGTTLGPAPVSKVRVFLAQGRSRLPGPPAGPVTAPARRRPPLH